MRIAMLAAVALLALTGATARAQSVSYDYDRSADFSRFQSYAWTRGTPLDDDINHRRVVNAVDTQLAVKGLRKVDAPDQADMVVAYHASFGRNLQITGFSTGYGPYRFGPGRSGTAHVDQILTGTLVVDLADARTKTIVWRGIAKKDVDRGATPEQREKNINRAAEKLFRNYPPKR